MALNLLKSLRLLSNSAICTATAQRTIFGPSALGIDSFKRYQERVQLENSTNTETLKKRIDQAITENKQIFTEDIKTLLYISRDEADLETLGKALRKYANQEGKVVEFSFGAPLMRLFYVLNKTDHALKFFNDPELVTLFQESATLLLLVNKLVEEKRFQEAVDVINKRLKSSVKSQDSRKFTLNGDLQKLYVEALYNLNSKEALGLLKEFIKNFGTGSESVSKLARMAGVNAVLLAIQQNDPGYAFELLAFLDAGNSMTKNLKVIVLATLGRNDEALDILSNLIESRDSLGRPADIFPLTMKTLRETIAKADNKALSDKLDTFSKNVISAQRLSQKDITEILFEVKTVRMSARQNAEGQKGGMGYKNRDGQQQNFGYNRQQRDGFGINRSSGGYGGERRPFGGESRFGGENRPFGGENRPFGGENRPFGGENRPFGGTTPFGRQQGTQNVGGYNRQPRGETAGRFDQGGQQSFNRFADRAGGPQQRSPPRRQLDNVDDD